MNNTQYLERLKSSIRNAIIKRDESSLKEVFDELRNYRRYTSSSQTRKFLELSKEIINSERKDLLKKIIKFNVVLDYQWKRNKLPEDIYNIYLQTIESLRQVATDTNISDNDLEKSKEMFKSIIEMITVYLSKKD
ncbi:MAG: hypothetical protein QXQ14_02990 [Candidatus Aenigmatarchaeota archaeon]